MNVHNLQIVLRRRGGLESVDLGFALARQHFGDLQRLSFGSLGPLALVLMITCWKWPWIALLAVWWLKPIVGRFILYYLSRRIFGEQITVKEIFKTQSRRFFTCGLWPWLTLRRFSPTRSMLMPVAELEQLRGRHYKKRLRTVKHIGADSATLLCFGLIFLKLLIVLSVLMAAASFSGINELELDEYYQALTENQFLKTFSNYWLCYSLIVVSLLIEPFYVAGGFALYLNSRIIQESWDVELSFKELATRYKEHDLKPHTIRGVLLTLVMGLSFSPWQSLQAQDDPQATIDEVLAHEDFIIHTKEVGRWEFSSESEAKFDLFTLLHGIDGFFKIIGILALVVLIGIIILLIYRTMRNRSFTARERQQKTTRPPPTVLMGMGITPESLPSNLLQSAQKEWQATHYREALSLLYRGALSKLVLDYKVNIQESDTEHQCLQRVKIEQPTQREYFAELTRQWIQVAYSQRLVHDDEFTWLLSHWPFVTEEK